MKATAMCAFAFMLLLAVGLVVAEGIQPPPQSQPVVQASDSDAPDIAPLSPDNDFIDRLNGVNGAQPRVCCPSPNECVAICESHGCTGTGACAVGCGCTCTCTDS